MILLLLDYLLLMFAIIVVIDYLPLDVVLFRYCRYAADATRAA